MITTKPRVIYLLSMALIGMIMSQSQATGSKTVTFTMVKRTSVRTLGANAQMLLREVGSKHPQWLRDHPVAVELEMRTAPRARRSYIALVDPRLQVGSKVVVRTQWQVIKAVYTDGQKSEIRAVERIVGV